MKYIRKCTLELLAYYYSNTDFEDFEDEFSHLLDLLKEAESINIIVNISKDGVLANILNEIDRLVEAKLVYQEEKQSDSIFKDVITDELATNFLYRLAHIS